MPHSNSNEHTFFISYSDEDEAWVQGYLIPALDLKNDQYTAKQKFSPGESKVKCIEKAIRDSRYTFLIISPSYLEDEWVGLSEHLSTYKEISESVINLIPIIYLPCDVPMSVDFKVKLDFSEPGNWETEIKKLRCLIDANVPDTREIECPYPGLLPYDKSQSEYFVGREEEIDTIIAKFRHQNFLIIIGPSGCGKSSLVFAGLINELSVRKPNTWNIKHMRPGSSPVKEIHKTILDNKDGERDCSILKFLETGELINSKEKNLLIIDQFEELFQQNEYDEQEAFIKIIKKIKGVSNCYQLLVIRADFYTSLMNSSLWPLDDAERLEIGRLRGEALKRAICVPAKKVGIHIENRLLNRLIQDAANEPGIMPLVQETMSHLWTNRKFNLITEDSYVRMGDGSNSGLAVALSRMADAAYQLFTDDEKIIVKRIFLRLIQFGQGNADTRRQLRFSELLSEGERPIVLKYILQCLATRRLIVLSGNESDFDKRVDIAHEALIQGWRKLQSWINERRESELVRRRFELKAIEWQRLGGKRGGLLDEIELKEVEKWMNSKDAEYLGYSKLLKELTINSRQHIETENEEKERQKEALIQVDQRRISQLKRLLTVVGLFLSATIMATLITWVSYKEMRSLAIITKSRELGYSGAFFADKMIDLALLLAVEANTTSKTFEAKSGLARTVSYSPYLQTLLHGRSTIKDIEISPDGSMLASAHMDSTVALWDLDIPDLLPTLLKGHKGKVLALSFNPKYNILASSSYDGKIILWDLDIFQPISEPINGNTEAITTLAFSSSGDTLISGSADNTIMLWDFSTKKIIGKFPEKHQESISDMDVSPDGKVLASASLDGSVILWDIQAMSPIGDPLKYKGLGQILSVSFSHDGKYLLTNSGVDLGVIWVLASRKPIPFKGGHGPILCSSFSPVDYTIAFGTFDNSMNLFFVNRDHLLYPDSAFSLPRRVLMGHEMRILNLAFGPKGRRLASVSDGGSTIYVWDLSIDLKGDNQWINKLSINSDEKILASLEDSWLNASGLANETFVSKSWNSDTTIFDMSIPANFKISPDQEIFNSSGHSLINFWDFEDRVQVQERGPLYSDSKIFDMSFHPNNKDILVTAHIDGTIKVWDIWNSNGDEPIRVLKRHNGKVKLLKFSSDGRYLASYGTDNKIHIWNGESFNWIEEAMREKGYKYDLTVLEFSPDGQTLVAGDKSGYIHYWKLDNLMAPQKFWACHPDGIYSLCFINNGKILASGGGGPSVYFWNLHSENHSAGSLKNAQQINSGLAMHSDGKTLIVVNGFKPVKLVLWDVEEKRMLGEPFSANNDHYPIISSLAFAKDKQILAVANYDGSITLYDLKFDGYVDKAKRIANRPLTEKEKTDYVSLKEPSLISIIKNLFKRVTLRR